METILKLWKGEINEESLYDPNDKKKIYKGIKDEKIIKEAEKTIRLRKFPQAGLSLKGDYLFFFTTLTRAFAAFLFLMNFQSL